MRAAAFLSLLLTLTAACRTPGGAPTGAGADRITLVAPADWPEFADDLKAASFAQAAARSIAYLKTRPGQTTPFGPIGVAPAHWIATLEELTRTLEQAEQGADLKALLAERFDLYRVGRGPRAEAHFSSYYMPTLPASRRRSDEYKYPLYAAPDDMLSIELGAFSGKLKGESVLARIDDGKVVPYFSRRDIDVREALKGRGLEIAWLKNAFDRLNIHIQGSGILRFEDGAEVLAAYAATNGRKYKSVGLTVVGAGAMTREEIDAAALKRYLKDHPEGEAWLISQNPRYTFFRLTPLPPGGEPAGKIGRALTAGRSIAVDPATVPLGAPAFVVFAMLQADAAGNALLKRPTRRFVQAQDVGGAIKGAGRVDLYVGHGPEAQGTAHKVWDKGAMYVLVKKAPPRNR